MGVNRVAAPWLWQFVNFVPWSCVYLSGGIFDQEDEGLANHFTLAVDRVNRDLGMLGATKFQAKVMNRR